MPKKTLRERSYLFLIISFAVLVLVAFILFFALQSNPIDEALKNDQILNVLFVLYDESDVITSDLIMYYPVTKRSAMFYIPNRTGAIWSSIGRVAPISDVYMQKGIRAYKSEVENLFFEKDSKISERIPFTMEISLDDFIQLVDFLGGLRLFIPSPVDERTETGTYLLPSGSVKLDGDKVYTYLKYKTEDDTPADIQERNQNIIVSLLSAMSENKKVLSSKKAVNEIYKLLNCNIDKKYLKKLLSQLANIDSEKLSPQTVTGSVRNVDGIDLLFPYYDGQLIKDSCKQSMNALVMSSEVSFSRTYVLDIQNGSTVQGRARNTAILLQGIGYDVLPYHNADRNDYEKTVIIDHINNPDVSKSIGDFLHCDNIVVEEVRSEAYGLDSSSMVDFTIILGKDFDGRYVRSSD